MINRMTTQPKAQTVIVGVDTHKQVHVAVAIATCGMRLGGHSFVADAGGYQALLAWAETYGQIEAFGIEGTGGYGVGLARAVCQAGHRVLEVNRGDRRLRRVAGKSDTIDAEAAARSVLAGQATQDRGRCRRDDAPAQSRAGHRHEGAHVGHDHAEADHRQRPAEPTRSPPQSHRPAPAEALRQPPPGSPRHAYRVRETHPAGARPPLVRPR